MVDEKMTPDANPNEFNYEKLAQEFSPEEQNAAAWLSLVLLLAENRAMVDGLRKLLVAKGVATDDEVIGAIKEELEQPKLGNWYGFMNQLYAFRVAETLDIQKQKRDGTIPEAEAPQGDLTDVAQAPIPTGPPAPKDIVASATINQAAPAVEGAPDGEKE
jgi:hypothetical protein